MIEVLRRRDFRLLWVAGLISSLGDLVLFIALPFVVYDMTGSTLATGAIMIVETIPMVFLGSLAGVFVDRWDRRRTMVAADLLRAIFLLPLLLVHATDTLWLVYAVGLVEAAIGQFFGPAKNALIPGLVSAEQLTAANALNGQAGATTGLIGPVLGGAVFAALGLSGCVLADGGSFIASALLVGLIRPVAPRGVGNPEVFARAARGWRTVWGEWRDGLRLIARAPVLIATLVALGAVVLADGVSSAVFVPLVRSVLHAGPREFGWMVSAASAAEMIGLLGIGRLSNRVAPYQFMAASSVAAAALMLILVNVPAVVLVILGFLLVGPAIPGNKVGADTLLQQSVDDAYRGRVFGAVGTTTGLVTLLGMAFSSGLGDVMGITATMDLAGAIYFFSGVVAVAMLRGHHAIHVAARQPTEVL